MLTEDDRRELEQRVDVACREIQAEIVRLRADGGPEAQERITGLETKLAQVRAVVHESWDCVTEAGAATLNEWLRRTQKEPAAHQE